MAAEEPADDPPLSDDTTGLETSSKRGNFTVGKHMWTMTRAEFRHIIGPVASDIILFNLWRVYGRATAKDLIVRRPNFRRAGQAGLREALIELVGMNGWADNSVEIKEAHGETSLSLLDCPFCEYSTSDKPVCFEMLGIVAGYADIIMGTECEVAEPKCIACRDRSCTFLIKYH